MRIPGVDATLDENILRSWVGRRQSMTDTIRPEPAAFMSATLEPAARPASPPQPGEPLPPGWHWLYFLRAAPLPALGRDGHAPRGGFLPPVALPRRMWAGGRLEFTEPLAIGETIVKHSTITGLTRKTGRRGELCFVTVRHEFMRGTTLKMTEEHDIVYCEDPREDTPPPAPPPAPAEADVDAQMTASSVLLFRYSALTFNSHRIHYDLEYCRKVEGYPGLVVHGPLTATLLAGLADAHRGAAKLAGFAFRAVSPLFAAQPFTIALKKPPAERVGTPSGSLQLWAANARGELAMSATARLPTGQT